MKSVPGIIIAAPASGHGKTTVTLGLIAALRKRGLGVGSFKVGPDYIDPAFHAVASGRPCLSLDDWAMRETTVAGVARRFARDAEFVVGEGVMGLFDGAPDGTGSTADVAARLDLPVLLVLDVRAQAASAAAVVHGFATFRPGLDVAGVVFNRVGSEGHARTLEAACRDLPQALLGCLPRDETLALPERHLGLVQASEHEALEAFIAHAAAAVEAHLDLGRLIELARPMRTPNGEGGPVIPVLGQRIAVARDTAFAFAYPHLIDSWRAAGAEIDYFSPLADEPPAADADAVYLPGGYPELHAGRLAANATFLNGLRGAAARGAAVYGECGGYMVLGRVLVDGDGGAHEMAGLLPVETSFAKPRLHLGYRQVTLKDGCALGGRGARFRGHEFHYASASHEDGDAPLFDCRDARGEAVGPAGCRAGPVFGSYVHLIDAA
ncbi:MAG TPA: cobyrinate a,c-diamide synthase [Alphaproteobacteria bacterium]|nr:cobyrinate a,c-diamide synthase [Alphaproteobacteria bacterium]